MQRKESSLWFYVGGFALAAIAGCINAVGFLGAHHQAVSHMSGNVTMLGLELTSQSTALAWRTFSVLVAFFFGCLLSGFILRQSTVRVGRRYGVVLAIESALLFGATHFLRQNLYLGEYLAAVACGLQNAMATSYSGTLVRTTHVTGMVTDLGIACGHMLRRQPVDWRRFQICGLLLTGFFAGGYYGALTFTRLGYDTLLFPATFAGCIGLGYAIFKHIERRQHHRSREAALRDLPSTPPAE